MNYEHLIFVAVLLPNVFGFPQADFKADGDTLIYNEPGHTQGRISYLQQPYFPPNSEFTNLGRQPLTLSASSISDPAPDFGSDFTSPSGSGFGPADIVRPNPNVIPSGSEFDSVESFADFSRPPSSHSTDSVNSLAPSSIMQQPGLQGFNPQYPSSDSNGPFSNPGTDIPFSIESGSQFGFSDNSFNPSVANVAESSGSTFGTQVLSQPTSTFEEEFQPADSADQQYDDSNANNEENYSDYEEKDKDNDNSGGFFGQRKRQ